MGMQLVHTHRVTVVASSYGFCEHQTTYSATSCSQNFHSNGGRSLGLKGPPLAVVTAPKGTAPSRDFGLTSA